MPLPTLEKKWVVKPPWSMHFVDDTDGLVHFAIEGYMSSRAGSKGAVYPSMAYTRCGHMVTWDGFRANAGTYVPHDVPLTCVPCAAGAVDGCARRQDLKTVLFAHAYGKNVNNVLAEYSEAERRIFQQYIKPPSMYGRCRRLASTLYLKATEADRA
jgi:hypothetical protein